jgi:hypothetical protein
MSKVKNHDEGESRDAASLAVAHSLPLGPRWQPLAGGAIRSALCATSSYK